ncbi:MAG: sugar phosphate permease [Deltaproteobacteria bacterium]|jgi:FSR family fosmidomycin resistance protein-like MFS transporter|nr:sugar phosphate permease [Deltaproteobacteria bacterium]
MKYRPIFPLALAHFACDLNQGALPILLPFFMAEHHITYAAAATIVFAANLVSTVTQPAFGYIADRQSRPWLIPLGVLIAGLGFSCAGIAPTYSMVLLVVAFSGLGVAIFHPEGARQAHRVAGDKKATAMSLFTFGGQLGFALGPLFATAILLAWGLPSTLIFALPAIAVAAFTFCTAGKLSAWAEHAGEHTHVATQPAGKDAWPAFFCVALAVVCRSIIFYGLNTFLPLFWMNVLRQSTAAGASALTILVAGGIIGNLIGGRLADRFGYRAAALAEYGLLACVLPLFLLTRSPVWAFLLLVPIGLLLSAPNSAMVVLGQTYLPNHIGFSSGVTMGLAFSFGGMTVPLLGWIADHHGLLTAISTVAFIPIVCAGLVLTLPNPKRG